MRGHDELSPSQAAEAAGLSERQLRRRLVAKDEVMRIASRKDDEGRVWIWSTSVMEPSPEAKETAKSEKNAHPNRAKPSSSLKRHSREKFSPFDWFRQHP